MDLEHDHPARSVDEITVVVLDKLQFARRCQPVLFGGDVPRHPAASLLAPQASSGSGCGAAPDAEVRGDLDLERSLEAGLLDGAGGADVDGTSGVAGFVWAGEPLGGVVEAGGVVAPAVAVVVGRGVGGHRRTETWMWS